MLNISLISIALYLAVGAGLPLAYGQNTPPSDSLKYVVIVSRHGVRSPTWTPEQLNQYSSQPWPKWSVKPGELTAHGRSLMKLFGAYYRSALVDQSLLAVSGCADSERVYIAADNDQRTLETGKALAEGLLPGCPLEVHSAAPDESDPLFNALAIPIGKPDRKLALGAVLGRVGGHPDELVNLYRPAFQELQRILVGNGKAPQSLLTAPVSVVPGKGDNLVDVTGAVRTASTLTENLLLEYTGGFQGDDLGWGRLNADNLRQILVLHTAYADLARRTPYLARARASNLLFHILASLKQAATGVEVQGALGTPKNRVLILSGHDTNLSNLSGMLGLSWLLPGYQPDDTPPGGALVLELRQRPQEPPRIRTYYIAQSLEQMRSAQPLTLSAPPLRAPLFLQGCSSASEGFDCTWTAFHSLADSAIDPEFVKR